MKLRKIKSGARRALFMDYHGAPCSIEESAKVGGTLLLGLADSSRMRLDRDTAGTLGRLLLTFERNGELAGKGEE